MRVASFSVTCSQGSNSARLTGEVCYEGKYDDLSTTVSMSNGERFGLFNVVATKVSGGDFTARFDGYAMDGPSICAFKSYGYSKSTDGDSSVSWDTGPEDWWAYMSFGTATCKVRFYVDWGNGETYADSSTFNFTVPSTGVGKTAYFDANGGSLAGNAYRSIVFNPTSSVTSVTIHRHNPTRSGYGFYKWSTDASGSGGYTYAAGGEWYGDHVDGNDRVWLYALWNPLITFDANGGNSAPASFYKTFGQAATISSMEPSHPSKMFLSWNTSRNGGGTSYQRGGTIPASMNDATTLYAQWRNPTPAPSISGASVIRCTSSGTQDDLGTYCRVSASWSVSRTYDGSNTGTLTGTIRGSDGTTRTITFDSGTSGQSGYATAIIDGIGTDVQYTITLTVRDTNRDTNHTSTTTRQVILTRAKFIMDFRAGGNAVGIGSAAPQSGLMVGYDTTFNGRVDFDGTVDGNGATWSVFRDVYHDGAGGTYPSQVFEAEEGFTVDRVELISCGPFHGLAVTAYGTVMEGEWTTIGRLKSTQLASKYVPRYMSAGFVWSDGIGYISTSGDVAVYSVDGNSSIIYVQARYF